MSNVHGNVAGRTRSAFAASASASSVHVKAHGMTDRMDEWWVEWIVVKALHDL